MRSVDPRRVAALQLAPLADLDAITTALKITVWATPELMVAVEAAVPQKNPNDD